jgi:S-adenosylmethionine:tRNA ribosyltransferase-isomerase
LTRIADFDYELPPELIAQEPLPERDASRLLVMDLGPGALEHRHFRDLPDLLRAGDLLVANRSRVFPARLLGSRAGGGAAEVLLVVPHGEGRWDALLRPGRRLRPGAFVDVGPDLRVRILPGRPRSGGLRPVCLEADGDPEEALQRLGRTPLPPYIRREPGPQDRERYQTVYARERGSVAAPTAGLHFTEGLRRRLQERGVAWAEVVLHVGPGTFRPVQTDQVEDHRVEGEPFDVPAATADAVRETRARGGRVVAVGTTAVRALETAADADGRVRAGAGVTDLVIVPGYRFRVIDALVTNFHLPRSSLLLLVAALAGRQRVLDAYAEAVRAGYRFYSYGDAMLVIER